MEPGIQNYYVRVGGDWTIVQPDELEELLKSGETVFTDTIGIGEGLRFTFIYLQDPDNPALSPPLENPSEGKPPQPPPKYSLATNYYDTFAEFMDRYANEERYINGEWVPTDNPPLNEDQILKLVFAHMTGVPSDDTFLNEMLGELETEVMEELAAEFEFPSIEKRAKALKERGQSLVTKGKSNLSFLLEQAESMEDGPEKEEILKFLREASRQLDDLENALKELDGVTTQEDLQAVLDKINDLKASFKEHLNFVDEFSFSDSYMARLLGSLNTAFGDDIQSLEGVINQINLYSEVESGNWSQLLGGTQDSFKESLEGSYIEAFEGLLKDLPPDQAAKLRFAFHYPELANPAIKEQLAALQAQAVGSLSKLWGIPDGHIPELSKESINDFKAEIGKSYYEAFESTLDKYDLSKLAQELGLTEDEVAGYIKYLHFHPDAKFPGSDQLKDAVADIEKIALGKVRGDYALPEDFEIDSGAVIYDSILNGEFMRQFDYNLNNWEPPLTSAQIAAIRLALGNPLNPNVTPETKTLIQQIYNKTVEGIRSEYNLPVTWVPPTSLLGEIGNISDKTRHLWNAINEIQDRLNAAYNIVNGMEDGPQRTTLLNILAIISKALADLKELIAIMQTEEVEISSAMTNLERGLLNLKSEEMKELREIQKEKTEKLKPWKDLMEWMGPTMMVFTCIFLTIVAGPVGLALATVLIVEAATKEDILGKAIQDAGNAAEEAGWPAGLVVAAEIAVITAVCLVAGPGGFHIGAHLFFQESAAMERFFTDVCKIKDPLTVAIITGSIQLAFEVAVMIFLCVVTGGGVAPLLIATVTARIAAMTIKALTKVLKAVMWIIDHVGKALTKVLNKLANWLIRTIAKLKIAMAKWSKIAAKLEHGTKALRKSRKMTKMSGKSARSITKDYGKQVIKEATEEFWKAFHLFDKLYKATVISKSGIEVYASIQEVRNEVILAEYALREGGLEAEISRIEAMIKLLRKILDKILEGLESSGTWISDVGDQQKKFWGDKSAVASQIAGALEG
ncbi:MAG: hypothetical protein K940chlam7_01635 [Chlamydiae bacterium]|nr:hypothetical protein [Chlamydiota bacterium]